MIINIRGTSGSGKSTIVKYLMSRYEQIEKIHTEGRRQPIAYVCTREGSVPLAVIGHYETPCGGCDTISSTDEIFRLVRQFDNAGCDVVFEGLLISADVIKTVHLAQGNRDLTVLALTEVPIEACLAGVNHRRRQRMKDSYTPVKEKNTRQKHRGVANSVKRLEAEGVLVWECTRETALEAAVKVLGVELDLG